MQAAASVLSVVWRLNFSYCCPVSRRLTWGTPCCPKKDTPDAKNTILFTWGGLRGGISVALALSLGEEVIFREEIVFITYVVVVFSIIVQGLSLQPLLRRLKLKSQ